MRNYVLDSDNDPWVLGEGDEYHLLPAENQRATDSRDDGEYGFQSVPAGTVITLTFDGSEWPDIEVNRPIEEGVVYRCDEGKHWVRRGDQVLPVCLSGGILSVSDFDMTGLVPLSEVDDDA